MTFTPALLSDPEVVAIGRMKPHSDHRWFASQAEVERGESSFEQSLDGAWKFHYSVNPTSAPMGFEGPDFDTSTWDDIRVPAHIQMEGYDRPQYVNTQYPWDGHEDISPPQVPTRFNPTASYVKTFTMDRQPGAGERVSVTFNGAESALAVWMNGAFVGYAEDSFTPSEFDVTEFLVEGENRLAAQVFKWCSGSWLEDQDFFRFSGLFRSVVLRTYPSVHAYDVRVGVEVAQNHSSALVQIDVQLQGAGEVQATLAGEPMGLDERGRLFATVSNPHLWSAEDPYLYDLELRVLDEGGAALALIPLKVGLRRFGIEDGVLKINGQRVVFFGVNRHEFGLEGRVMTREQTEADLIMLKAAGVNAIRTSHYPNNSFFYELADFYGFYVIDEMNLESHGLWDNIRLNGAPVDEAVPGNKSEWVPALLDRAANMYQRDKNHPSIVMWSCGNESFGGSGIAKVAEYFRAHDTRPVHYEGIVWDERYPQTSDVRSEMYTPAATVEAYLKENRDKPFILCEYAHAMGNSFGAVDRYIDLAFRDPLFQGGFIWDFADQALLMNDRYGNRYFGYGGDFGEAPHDGEFCGNGIYFADRTATPRLQEVKYLYQGIAGRVEGMTVHLHNRFNFTSTAQFDCVATLSREGRALESASLVTDVAPGQSGVYPLPLTFPSVAGEYTVDVSFRLREDRPWADAGYEIAHEQGILVVEGDEEPLAPTPAPRVVRGMHNIGVHGSNFSAIFSRLYGGLQGYRYCGKDLLKAVPMPNFWHAPTSNEKGWGGPFEDGQWLLASRYARFQMSPDNPSLEERDGQAVVTYLYELPTVPLSACTVEYAVDGSGRIEVTLTLDPGEGLSDLPEFGVLFKTGAELSQLTWYGEGPSESYVDRRLGARVGVFQQRVDEQLTPYLRPQEAGSHTEVRWAEVTDDRGRGLRFEAAVPMEFSALPWSPFEVESAAHHNELPPVSNTFIRPALARRGVAGDDTWGARPHAEFLIPAQNLVFKFAFQGLV